MREHSKESWQSWYSRVGTGQLVRQAITAVCLLNEIIFGVSDKAVDTFARMFQEYVSNWEEKERFQAGSDDIWHCKFENLVPSASIWKISHGNGTRSHLIDCVGSILHEYLSAEVWSLLIRHKSSVQ